MKVAYQDKRKIYDRTTGYCHICRKKLSFGNYGLIGQKGAWEIEHSNPKSLGGSDRFHNLYASCISCNRRKNNKSTLSVRREHGLSRAPLSNIKRKEVKKVNSIAGAIIGGVVGSVMGPWGAIVCSSIGAKMGYDRNPDIY
ncbi:MAG: HNH endonuclease [Ignavibacteriaceae bacterium]|nr:HNH endonuclease [Ignavibacteriaceae bacterium]